MKKLIYFYPFFMLLGVFGIFSSCQKEFEPKSFIIIGGAKSGSGIAHEGEVDFWTSDENNFAARHYFLDDDHVDDFRATILKSWASKSLTLTYLHSEVFMLAEPMEIITVIDSAWLNDSTYTLVKALYNDTVTYSSQAVFETETKYVPMVLNSGDRLELDQKYVQEVLCLDYSRFDDETDPVVGDYTHAIRYSPMAPVSEKYIGVKQIVDNKVYLGWIKISSSHNFDIKIHETYIERVE